LEENKKMNKLKQPNNPLSRRDFLQTAAVIGTLTAGGSVLSTLLASCSRTENQIELTHFIWVGGGQGDIPREVIPNYLDGHPNVKIELYEGTNAETYPKMVAAREADPNKPLIHFGFFNIDGTVRGTYQDMWVSLDPQKIPNMKDIYEGFHRPENKGIGWGMLGLGILYNTDFVEEPPTTWLDLIDPKFRGKVILWDADFKRHLLPIAHALGGNAKNVEESWDLISKAAKDGQFVSLGTSNDDMKNA
jgi:putative spermidine/putrescine transport system substrate-binding protein